MDLLSLKLLILFSAVGCCWAQHALPEGPLYAMLGQNVTFQTTANPEETFVTISWTFHDGTELIPIATIATARANVEDDYIGRVWVNSSTGVMTLGPLRADDTGDYAVNMVNDKVETKTGETKLLVFEPISMVTITPNMADAIEGNSTVILTCSAKGSFLTYSWTNKSVPIVADGTSVKLNENSTQLTLVGVWRTQLEGPIYCTAANKLQQEMSSPFNLTVSYGPENVVISGAPATPVIKKGSNVTLSCMAQSSPAATLQWFHNGQLLKETGPKLALSDVQENQDGNYSCTAHNTKTLRYVSSAMAKFTVMEPISGIKITGPAGTLIAGNHTANLSCIATAGSITTRAWLKDSKPLSPSDRVVISADKSSVMIKKVQKEDNGEYTCQLTNDVGTDSSKYKLVVNFGPEKPLMQGEEAVEVMTKITLECAASSVPAATYTWKFNGTMKPVTTPIYTVDSATYKDSGVYTCEAHNAITGMTSSVSHTLSVKEDLDEGLSDGAIAGIVIAVLVALAAAIAGVIYWRRKQEIASPY